MSAHTPGPWSTDPDVGHESVLGPDGILLADCSICTPTPEAASLERCRANARLIAAAPELLACLREIVRDAPETEPEYGDWGGDTERAERWGSAQEHWRLAELARAALAKAQGVEHPAAHDARERVLARSATSYESRLAAQEASERAPSVLAGIQEAAEAAGRMHAIWEVFCGRSADATPEDLCLAYVRAYFDYWGQTLPDLTTDQAVQWVGRR